MALILTVFPLPGDCGETEFGLQPSPRVQVPALLDWTIDSDSVVQAGDPDGREGDGLPDAGPHLQGQRRDCAALGQVQSAACTRQ